jgi:plastocyanin
VPGRRSIRTLALALALALLPAGTAAAATTTVTRTVGPIRINGYEVRQESTFGVPTAGLDGYITDMRVNVVDKRGRPLPISRIMLHHVVFLNGGTPSAPRRDRTCGTFTLWNSRDSIPALAERFYAAGEERAEMHLPPGYGYPVSANDTWFLNWMLMNHRQQPDVAYIRYTMRVETDVDLRPVTPYWLDVVNCLTDPIYNVPGGAPRGASTTRSATWTIPAAGRLVAAIGHVHGGGERLAITQPACGNREIVRLLPTWGSPRHPFYRVRPILHEPGPIDMTEMRSATGIPVAAGSELRLDSTYEASRPHTRVMGIAIAYLAPDASVTDPCGPLPDDIAYSPRPAGRLAPPPFAVPLTGIDPRTGRAVTIAKPPGRRVALPSGATVRIRNFAFSRPNVLLRKGARLRWRFDDNGIVHNVTLASGPIGFGSPNRDRGTFAMRFTKRGTYRIFCALHPVAMTESVVVR